MLSRFRIYSVYLNPAMPRPYEAAEFVPEGFNVYAFMFGALWALYHRLWVPGFILIGLNVLIEVLGARYNFAEASILVLQLGLQLAVGLQANDVWARALMRRGYILADLVTGSTLLHAEQRFYDRYLPTLGAQPSMLRLADA